jgi:hypothetical protein
MQRFVQLILAAVLCVPAAVAQQAGQSAPADGGPANSQGGGNQGGAAGLVNWFLGDMDQNVGLTDAQKEQLRASLDPLSREAIDRFRSSQPTPPDPGPFRAFREQLQQAAAAGDDARVRQFQEQAQSTGPGAVFREMRDRAMDEVRKVLTPDQQEAYRHWRAVWGTNLPRPTAADTNAFKDAALKVSTLSDVQRSELEAAFQRYDEKAAGQQAASPVQQNMERNRLTVEVQRILRPAQQVLVGDALLRQMIQRSWAAGGKQPAGGGGRTGGGGRPNGPSDAGPGHHAGGSAAPIAADAWTIYVQRFVTAHELDDAQQTSAYNILHELKKRVGEYWTAHKMDLDDLGLLASLATTPEEQAAIDSQRKIIDQPIDEMFQELKDRLARLLPAEQQAAAGRAAGSQPAASQPPAPRRAPGKRRAAAQPAATPS